MKNLPQRNHPRLKDYDYSRKGAYFITFCVKDMVTELGSVGRDALGAPIMKLSEYGIIIHKEIEGTSLHYEGVSIDTFIIMPNHIHMIITIQNGSIEQAHNHFGAPEASRPTMLIPRIIAIIKKKTNKQYGFNMWQRSFYEHIIRNEAEYLRIWQYIIENPAKWAEDKYYSQ